MSKGRACFVDEDTSSVITRFLLYTLYIKAFQFLHNFQLEFSNNYLSKQGTTLDIKFGMFDHYLILIPFESFLRLSNLIEVLHRRKIYVISYLVFIVDIIW
jgi:hypothetical protein